MLTIRRENPEPNAEPRNPTLNLEPGYYRAITVVDVPFQIPFAFVQIVT